jgi:biotin carboxylase
MKDIKNWQVGYRIFMEKIIMVLAGTYWQIPIVQKIKAMGFKSLVVNLYEDSPAFEYSDFSVIADILDKEKCLQIAKEYNIDAILSEECDIAMPTVAFIAKQMKLSALSIEHASLFTNKYMMRNYCKKINFPSPEYALCRNQADVKCFFEKNKQSIIKPLDSNSSRGVFLVDSIQDIDNNFLKCQSFSKNDNAILAEEYIQGTEFTVDGIVINRKHYSLAISEKKHYKHNPNIACQLFFSYLNEEYDYERLRLLNNYLIENTFLEDGCLTHVEYKYDRGQFYLIEMAARGGGNLISSDIVPIMSDIDNYKYLIMSSLGAKFDSDIKVDLNKERCAVLYFFDVLGNEGFVKSIEGIDYMNNNKNILKFKLNFSVGDYIQKVNDDSKRIGFYIAYAENKKKLIEIMDLINNKFAINIA